MASQAVEFNTTSALANYATEAAERSRTAYLGGIKGADRPLAGISHREPSSALGHNLSRNKPSSTVCVCFFIIQLPTITTLPIRFTAVTRRTTLPIRFTVVTRRTTLPIRFTAVTRRTTLPIRFTTVTRRTTLPIRFTAVTRRTTLPIRFTAVTRRTILPIRFTVVTRRTCLPAIPPSPLLSELF
uniref:Uncharacterized protein n=1 Tax=Timema douglasi TaxID=61478 RepID=A0A7R8ZBI5_TIMDO|nr:unnamed protein product [Timema douglasi]